MAAVFWLLPLIVALVIFYTVQKQGRLWRYGNKFPGPNTLPFLGNALSFATTQEKIYQKLLQWSKEYERYFRAWIGPQLFVLLYHQEDVEVLLSSNTHIDKSDVYEFAKPLIGNGILVTSGNKWKAHRRIITPTFHFKILEDFVDVFNKNGTILCDKLSAMAGKGTFNVYPFVNLAALDNIAESAMGIELNSQVDSNSTYVRAVKDMCTVITSRMFKLWLRSDLIFSLTHYSKLHDNALQVLTETAMKVIQTRRKELREVSAKDLATTQQEDDGLNQKKRLAFLDLLLKSEEGSKLSDQDIRAEVDTFMFAGHDTVTSGISFALYCLSLNPEVQEECYREQIDMFGDSDRPPTSGDLNEMKYLERTIKEVQRLYPSVPLIARALKDDLVLSDGTVAPAGAQLVVLILALHKDPKVWDNPEQFDPDNFLPDNIQHRHPFAYVPFSAGSRNCVGQRFAMMEMKATVSKVIREFKILPSEREHAVQLNAELVLISNNGVNVQLELRN